MHLIVHGHRLASHGFALSAVTALVLVSAVAPRVTSAQSDPTPSSQEPALVQLDVPPLPTATPDAATQTAPTQGDPIQSAPSQGTPTQGADQRQSTLFDPHQGLPQWLQGMHDVSLWSGGDPGASLVETVPAAAAFVKPLGPFGKSRIEVYFPGDAAHPSAQAWVDTTAVEPSSVPAWIAPSSSGSNLLAAAPTRSGDDDAPQVTARHIAIIDEASGQMLYGLQPNTEVPQASTTKIATTIVALERSPDLTRRIPVTISASAMAARDGSSTMGIEPGHTVSLDTLLHGMMLPSGNDAAEQVALALADSRDQYVDWMNQEAAALGLKDTHFVNPSGMDADGHYSSAYDMAMLARYAMHNATFRDLASTDQYTSDGFVMHNLNRLLDLYTGADGVKIGYTDNAQKTIVASATRSGHRVYVSLMHSQDLVGDCTALFNWVWDNFSW